MFDWLTDLKNYLRDLAHDALQTVFQFYHDMGLKLVRQFLDLIAELVNSVPAPDWMAEYSLGALLSHVSPVLGYFVDRMRIGAALGIIGLGYTFRITRKILTALQW